MNSPLVSIILPVFNGQKTLNRAIDSVLNQTHQNFELIIIDDASTDHSRDIINFYLFDPRIKLIVNEKNLHIVRSLNRGLDEASGDFIARIDADDYWVKEKLKLQLTLFEKQADIYLCGTSAYLISDQGKMLRKKYFNQGEKRTQEEIKRLIPRRNPFCHSSVMFRSSLLTEIGVYNPKYKHCEDYEFWIRVIEKYPSIILKEKLVFYQISKSMISKTHFIEQLFFLIVVRFKAIKTFKRYAYLPIWFFDLIVYYPLRIIKRVFLFILRP